MKQVMLLLVMVVVTTAIDLGWQQLVNLILFD